jgi:hypothetical protein
LKGPETEIPDHADNPFVMKHLKPVYFLILAAGLLSCKTGNKIMLFNGENLDNWEIFVSGDEQPPGELFWVEDGVIRTSGRPNGYIRTRGSYQNFKLHVEWRWLEEPTNSGVLLHVQGEDRIWPLSVECQLMNGHAGDIVLIGKGSGLTVKDSVYLTASEENRFTVIGKFEESSEFPAGEWNSYDITCQDGRLEVLVNGVLQNAGTGMTLAEGNILLQSEGSPMEFRNITLELL